MLQLSHDIVRATDESGSTQTEVEHERAMNDIYAELEWRGMVSESTEGVPVAVGAACI